MRWIHTGVIAGLLVAILIFAVQNFQSVTVSFLNFSLSAPLALQIVVIYLLGMATGSSAWALMRWAWTGPDRAAGSA
jgi:uncharacterized integral membrane protein